MIRLGKGLDRVEASGESWRLGAGLPGPLAARRTAEAGWAGLHKFVGVPGSVGGGVYMNAGCHGGEWAEVVTRVLVVDGKGQERWLMRADVPFTYRRSGLDGLVVLEADVTLKAGAAGAARRGGGGAVPLAAGGDPVQPAVLRQRLQEPGWPELAASRGAAHGGTADRGGRPQGHPDRWRGDFSDARQLLREHGRRVRGRRPRR